MENSLDFNSSLKDAIEKKGAWLNTEALPKLLDNYRLIHVCVQNLFDLMDKHGLITPDPYKASKNYEDIELPQEESFNEAEISQIMGLRISEYESNLNFACNYYKFSTNFLNFDRIEKLKRLSLFINWTTCTPSNPKPNTRAMGILINELRKKSQFVSTTTLNDMVRKNSEATAAIQKILSSLLDFQKEAYKFNIRENVLTSKEFNSDDDLKNIDDESLKIKRALQKLFPKQKIYADLIQEISEENHGLNKEELKQKVLASLKIPKAELSKTKKNTVKPRKILMESLKTLASLAEEFSILAGIVSNNFLILEGEHNSIFQRLKKMIRRALNLKIKPVIYTISINDNQKKSKYQQAVDMNTFIDTLERKENLFFAISDKNSNEYIKIYTVEDESLLQFVNKQVSETREIFLILSGLDEYFKNKVSSKNKSKIRGLKIELLTLQNAVISANQKRVEYINLAEQISKIEQLGMDISE